MIEKISMWSRGIIIAIIIGTIIQMIIPENKNKKYIKVIIGIYILFCILNPVTGTSFDLDDYNIERFVTINQTNEKNSETYNSNVEKMYKEKIVKTIKRKLNDMGYESENISVEIDEKYNINSVNILNIYEYKKDSGIVNKVEINIKQKPALGIANSDKETIKDFISNNYNVDINLININ